MLLLLVWVMMSSIWSANSQITILRGFVICLGTLYGMLLYIRYGFDDILKVMGVSFGIILISSLLAVMLFPNWSIMEYPHQGAWKGILFHKNALGRYSALSFVVFWSLYRRYLSKQWLFFVLISLLAIVGSKSATSLILVVCIFFMLKFLEFFGTRTASSRLILGANIIAVMYMLFVFVWLKNEYLHHFVENFLKVLGKDPTLTGRLVIWRLLINMGVDKIWTGYGFGAFWQGYQGPSAVIWQLAGPWPNAHNGYLEILLSIGIFGFIMSIVLLFELLYWGMRMYYRNPLCYKNLFLCGCGIYFVLSNLSGSFFLSSGVTTGIFYWILFVFNYLVVKDLRRGEKWVKMATKP